MHPLDHDTNDAHAPKCRCGRDRNAPALRPAKRYGWFGLFALLMGYTARPVRVDWQCPTCGAVLDVTTDRATLEQCRYDEPRRTARSPATSQDTREP